jgi:hypothetical protein
VGENRRGRPMVGLTHERKETYYLLNLQFVCRVWSDKDRLAFKKQNQ